MGAWRDSNGLVWRCRKSDGWPIDSRAADGVVSYGYRRIRTGGRVKLGGLMCWHPDLVQHAGRMARVQVNDFWFTGLHVWLGNPEATPETLFDRNNGHHSSFFDGVFYRCNPVGEDPPKGPHYAEWEI